MAKIVSPVWSSIRGSIAGTTYLTTSSGAIIARQRVKPVNPGSLYQGYARSALASANAYWEAAEEAERQGWDQYAAMVGYTSGRRAFFAGSSLAGYLNTRFSAVIPQDPQPPVVGNIINISDIVVVQPTGPAEDGLTLNFTNWESEALKVLVQVSPAFNPTRNYWKGPWDASKAVVVDAASLSAGTHDFELIVGQKYFFKVRAVTADGPLRVSSVWYTSGIAQEASA